MKREILFKAQRADGGGWVYGGCYVDDVSIDDSGDLRTFIHPKKGVAYEVLPETVCQLTEFNAKGRKLFVGDVIESTISDGSKVQHQFISVYQLSNIEYGGVSVCRQEWIDECEFEFSHNIHDKTSSNG